MNNITEDSEQVAVVQYCELMGIPVTHTPNEGKRSKSYGAKLKKMGMRKGFPDLLVTRARGGYHGLAIEMKVGNNKPTEDQKWWLRKLASEGYKTAVCYGADEAIGVIKSYEAEEGDHREIALFALVYNSLAPLGSKLGKAPSEIADKALQTLIEGENKVDFKTMGEKLEAAKRRT